METVRPHRAYSRLRPVSRSNLFASLALVAALEALVAALLGRLADVVSGVAGALAVWAGVTLEWARDDFLGLDLAVLSFAVAPLDYVTLLVWVVGGAAALVIVPRVAQISVPVRYLIQYNAAVLTASAVYLLFAGHLGYSPEAFSRLYLRTAVVVWLIIPAFVGGVSLALPFRPRDRLMLMLAALAYDVAFSAVRYALFAWALAGAGAVIMPDLYLFFGPILDFVFLVGIFTVFVTRLAHRLGREPAAWRWL